MANPFSLQQQSPQPNHAQVRVAPSQQNGARIHKIVLTDEEKSFSPASKR